ncbi:fluoride efflux transporter CrcB [Leptospira stimsonii]|uniref:Fluoride-specific ion channel FluC n=1 Tax=Leptospira stimsonii TaxID=2202203 RepID=A0A4R9L706_9LEPT|nr:fluoride efflux transporter CrcB [Leptospira stimsonii]RHX85374.1 fluoride efflux transporter CrcB [Leptospira stimsonii]TGK15789.1 fluoride efflux transporter CrcB [Leptospira stimsonii]TGM13607.1 fluoride efflux transporter CrcB [Leptospira stimsonii]
MNLERTLVLIGIGGALGSLLRYLLQYWFGTIRSIQLPWGTLIANLLGSLLIGIIYAVSERFPDLNPEWRFFLASGFCGGFTTFSTFSFESFQMLKTGNYILFFAYISISVFAGIGLALAGFWIVK